MRQITCHNGQLQTLLPGEVKGDSPSRLFRTQLEALDAMLPAGGFARGAIHELLSDPQRGRPLFFAATLARAAAGSAGTLIWCDPQRNLYPPALAMAGIDLRRLYLLRTRTAEEQLWAVSECLRCKGVSAVVASLPTLTQVQARRLQLAAERGGGVGIILRTADKRSIHYAASTRWFVTPARGSSLIRRWHAQLIHAPGGASGESCFLEYCRETQHVRARTPDQVLNPQRPASPRMIG